MDRHAALVRFYALLDRLEDRCGGRRRLGDCDGRMAWPRRGVYFFFESGERRADSGSAATHRVVRIGTHALNAGSCSTLWGRLSTHRGTRSGGGHHRGSIFRLLVGSAIKGRDESDEPRSWGVGSDKRVAARKTGLDRDEIGPAEAPLEKAVNKHIGAMSVLWIDIGDAPGPQSDRGYVERNAIGLVSNFDKPPLDAPSASWLGRHSDRERVRRSGLWNNNHVDEAVEPEFLDRFERLIEGR